jgi:hypothetical protein
MRGGMSSRFGAALVAAIALGCGTETTVTTKCAPGGKLSCQCENGRLGSQICGPDEQFGPCSCEMPTTSGSGGSSGATGSSGSSGGSAGSGVDAAGGGKLDAAADVVDASHGDRGVLLSSGMSPLVDVFVSAAGVIVVTTDAVTLVDRAGAVQGTYASPREITAAAFDGTSLVVFDKAFLVVLGPTLAPSAVMTALVEVCASAAFVGGDRVVCGSAKDFGRSFYAFNATTGAALQTTAMSVTYHGLPMRRVPGKDDFVTVSVGTSPSDFFLHTVDATSKVAFISDSPYHGDFAVSMAFSFEGNPAHHVVTEEGLLLNIYDPACVVGRTPAQCFVKDGMLGTLRGTQRFIGMADDGTNMVYGLVDSGPPSGFAYRRCASGCLAQRVDGDQRVVGAEKLYDVDVGAVIATRHDAMSNALVVGFRRSGSYSPGVDPYPGYRVELLKYE